MPPEFRLDNTTALITGAGRGIGAGIVEVFAEAGATVVVNALTDKYLVNLTTELRKQYGDRVIGLTGDATTSEGVARLVAQTTEKTGAIDILVNGVGDAIRGALVPRPDTAEHSVSDADIHTVLGLNLMSAIYCTRAVGAGMLARRRGKIIHISSFSAVKGSPLLSIYSVGKAGVTGLTKSLALEWAPFGVTVNAIAPGIFPDPLTQSPEIADYMDKNYLPRIPLGRYGKPREVGLLALYLASSAADYMTGQVLALDGGLTV